MLRHSLLRFISRRGLAFQAAFPGPPSRLGGGPPGSADIYIAANRLKFYKSIGLFCLLQGTAWSAFTVYLLSKSLDTMNWDCMKADLNAFNVRLATTLEAWTPEVIRKAILRPKSQPTPVAEKVDDKAAVVEAKQEEEEEPFYISEAKGIAEKMRAAIGLVTEGEQSEKDAFNSKRMVPLLCGVMGEHSTYCVPYFEPL